MNVTFYEMGGRYFDWFKAKYQLETHLFPIRPEDIFNVVRYMASQIERPENRSSCYNLPKEKIHVNSKIDFYPNYAKNDFGSVYIPSRCQYEADGKYFNEEEYEKFFENREKRNRFSNSKK